MRIVGTSVLSSGRIYQFAILVQVGMDDLDLISDQSQHCTFELLVLIKHHHYDEVSPLQNGPSAQTARAIQIETKFSARCDLCILDEDYRRNYDLRV